MTVPDSEILAKGREVRDKAIQKWMETEAELGAFLDNEMGEAYRAQVAQAFDFIPVMFEHYTQRDPTRIDAMRDHLRGVRFTLMNPATEGIDTIKGKISDWTGDAAEHFWGNYLEELPKVNDNQLALVGVLDAVLGGVQTMLDESRTRIIDIGDRTISALDAIEDGGGGGGLGLGLTIVAAVAGVVSAATGNIPAAAASFAVVAGAASIGASVADDADEMTISGTNVQEVISDMVRANNQLWETQNIIETDIADLLNQDLNMVIQNPTFFHPPMPFVGGFNAADGLTPEELAEFQPPA